MADIELVIKIPEEAYKLLRNEGVDWLGAEHILNAVAKGTPLPKHHGRLGDLEQEPFINKPCISSGVCEHDKNKALILARAEIENTAYDWQEIDGEHESRMVVDLNDVLKIIDKYKAERSEE